MPKSTCITIDPSVVLKVAGSAGCSPAPVARYLNGETLRSRFLTERIANACREHGVTRQAPAEPTAA